MRSSRKVVMVALPIVVAIGLQACGDTYTDAPDGADAASLDAQADMSIPDMSTPEIDAGSPDQSITDGGHADADAGPADGGHADAEAGPVEAGDGAAPILSAWTALDFDNDNVLGTCTGARYVAYDSKYKLWVGVRLCSATRYKIYLASTENGTYYEIGDGSGGGEDQCEFVRPGFTLGTTGEINSGDCPTCNYNYAGTGTTGGAGHGAFVRSAIGETPVFHAQWPSSDYTAHWFECGVSIP